MDSPSEDAYARDNAGIANAFAWIAAEVRSASERVLADDTNIRRELAGDLVTQAQTGWFHNCARVSWSMPTDALWYSTHQSIPWIIAG